jgi:hypothetical protein
MERVGCVEVVSGRKRMVCDKRVQTLCHVPLRLPFSRRGYTQRYRLLEIALGCQLRNCLREEEA